MKIALFGGRFDPVHNGHVAVAKGVLRVNAADEVWFIPENQHQWNPIVASVNDRIAMLKLVLQKEMKINDIAIQLGGITETISVARALRQKNPEHEYFFVCGSDLVPTFPKWTHWEELEKELHFLII